VKCVVIKLLEQNVGENLCDDGLDNEFLDIRSRHDPYKKNDKLDFIQIKHFYSCEKYLQEN
jgi:hypothetical protein